MAHIIDISHKMDNEPKYIKLNEKQTYKVDDRKNTAFKVMALWDGSGKTEAEAIDGTIKLILGKKAFDEINSSDITIEQYRAVAMAVLASISGEMDVDAFERRFQSE